MRSAISAPGSSVPSTRCDSRSFCAAFLPKQCPCNDLDGRSDRDRPIATRLASSGRMPVYEYECRACKTRFSEAMSVDDHDKRKLQCPNCKNQNIEQVIGAAFVKATKKS